MQQAEGFSDLTKPPALLCVVHISVGIRRRRFDKAPEEMTEKIDGLLQVFSQAGIQQLVHNTLLIAGVRALNVVPLQFYLKSLKFLRELSDLVRNIFHCLILALQVFGNPRHRKKWQKLLCKTPEQVASTVAEQLCLKREMLDSP